MQPTINIVAFALDDDAAILQAIGAALEADGVCHQLFTNGNALVAALHTDVHICIIDYYLTGRQTGLEVLQQVLAHNPHCFTIIMSCQNDHRVVARLMNAGACRYVVKGDEGFLQQLRHFVQEGMAAIRQRFAYYAGQAARLEALEESGEILKIIKETISGD